jgi:uncharacterized protein
MWNWVAELILRFRYALLTLLGVATLVFGYYGFTKVEISHEFLNVVPLDDPDMKAYLAFRDAFGRDGNATIIALESDEWFDTKRLNALRQLSDSLKGLDGIANVVNITTAQELVFIPDSARFETRRILQGTLADNEAAQALGQRIAQLTVYRDLLIHRNNKMLLCAVTYDDGTLSSPRKNEISNLLTEVFTAYGAQHQVKAHFTGMPYIRTYMAQKLPKELSLFMVLCVLLTAAALFIFYRSLYAVIFPLLLLVVSSLWTLGIIGLLGYKLNQLTAMLPPIIIILGIPPSIYMLSDYHEAFHETRDKWLALRKMVQKLGLVTFMINANTAFGFLTLYFTDITPLQQFGLVAFLGTMVTYLITLVMIPGIFSLLPSPSDNRLKHLHAPGINALLAQLLDVVNQRRKWVYGFTILIMLVATVGMYWLVPVSFMVDDLPKGDRLVQDLRLMEKEMGGVMPFEIVIDSEKPNGVNNGKFLKKLAAVQSAVDQHPEISRTISVADVWKWSRQAMLADSLGPDSTQYSLPTADERSFILRYLQGTQAHQKKLNPNSSQQAPERAILQNLVDSSKQQARITCYVADLGSLAMPALIKKVEHQIDSIFQPAKPKYYITGTTRIFLKTNAYLIDNLVWSLVATFLIIGLQMLLLFRSWRVMIISLIPNIIPLWVMAGAMGWMHIYLKPSTALIYELAFGIAIDNSIHYLAAYYYYLRRHQSTDEALNMALRVTGMGIIYTSVVLFVGFGIFSISDFDSTRALGILTACTIFIALFSNLLLLPALLRDIRHHPNLRNMLEEE